MPTMHAITEGSNASMHVAVADSREHMHSATPVVVKQGYSPYIGDNGHWYVYDASSKKFVDTGVIATGPKGDKGDGVIVKGHFDTLDLLQRAIPVGNVGDYYEVGTAPDNAVIYYWDAIGMGWYGIDIVDGQREARAAAAEAQASATNAQTAAAEAQASATNAQTSATDAQTAAESVEGVLPGIYEKIEEVQTQGETNAEEIAKIAGSVGTPSFAITEDMVNVRTDDTKGVAPWNASYGMTYIQIDKNAGVQWVDGALYTFIVSTKMVVTSAYRNVAVRIGGDDDGDVWHCLMDTSAAINGEPIFVKSYNTIFQYKTVFQAEGALHKLTDNNTTYAYLVNSVTCDATGSSVTIDPKGYGANHSIIWPTTPVSDSNGIVVEEFWSSLVASSSTSISKKIVTPTSGKFYIDRHHLYITTASVAAGAKPKSPVYQDYTGVDIRYTANTSNTYVTSRQKMFMWLKNFDPVEMSFESDAAVGNIMTLNKISTRFPSSVVGDIYLYFLGWSGASWFNIIPAFTTLRRIYRYTPSTGQLVATDIIAG